MAANTQLAQVVRKKAIPWHGFVKEVVTSGFTAFNFFQIWY